MKVALPCLKHPLPQKKSILLRHRHRLEIDRITFIESKGLLATVDISNRVLITIIDSTQIGYQVAGVFADLNPRIPVFSLIPETTGTSILIEGPVEPAEVWTISGTKTGTIPDCSGIVGQCRYTNHPSHDGILIRTRSDMINVYSWSDGSSVELHSSTVPFQPSGQNQRLNDYSGNSSAHSSKAGFVSSFYEAECEHRPSVKTGKIIVWDVSSVDSCNPPTPRALSIPAFDKYSHHIRKVIGLFDNFLYFLDLDFWVCSLDLTKTKPSAQEVKRHFFLLPEWQDTRCGFMIENLPLRREFVVSTKHGLIVIGRGLEFEAPWYTSWVRVYIYGESLREGGGMREDNLNNLQQDIYINFSINAGYHYRPFAKKAWNRINVLFPSSRCRPNTSASGIYIYIDSLVNFQTDTSNHFNQFILCMQVRSSSRYICICTCNPDAFFFLTFS